MDSERAITRLLDAAAGGDSQAAADNPATLFSIQQRINDNAAEGDEITLAYEGAVIFDAGESCSRSGRRGPTRTS